MPTVLVRKSQPIFVGRHKRLHEPHTVTTGGRLHVHKLAEDLDTMKLGGTSRSTAAKRTSRRERENNGSFPENHEHR